MSPVMLINTMQIRQGQLEKFKESVKKAVKFVEANGPQVMVQVYIDAKNMRAYSFQLYRDSESILAHWKMSASHIDDVMLHSTVERLDVYGEPNDAVMEGLRGLSEDGVTLTVTPHLYGFSRFRTDE
ncbi:MAG: hypothetical protein GEV00_23420 [Actinophytocola sp.]|nr:hypothetical protein [Actinophytocola sp.]